MRALIALCMSALCIPVIGSAQVVISEIMFDVEGADAGHEWIEVFNEGADVRFSDWKLFEGSNHGISGLGHDTLLHGAYAIIADKPDTFTADWPEYSGLLFDSAFSLNNSGETLRLLCCGKALAEVDVVTYSSGFGGAGDGSSLSREGVGFVASTPTPGAPNVARVPRKAKLPSPLSLDAPAIGVREVESAIAQPATPVEATVPVSNTRQAASAAQPAPSYERVWWAASCAVMLFGIWSLRRGAVPDAPKDTNLEGWRIVEES